jgi:tetratricopeptide (TPR) repeat protein
MRKIEESRLLLDEGRSREAEAKLTAALKAAGGQPTLVGLVRCVLSEALESQGRYSEAFEAVKLYEAPEARAELDPEVSLLLRVRLGLAYNYTGDYPKAIALLNTTLREAESASLTAQRGSVYLALARVYRSINEYTIARDLSQKALECYRQTGDWRGLAESYFGISVADVHVGDYEALMANSEQALQLIGERPAPHLLGKIYANMAGGCWFLKRPHDGIRYLEKAVEYYERTEHKANASLGFTNLGANLILIGEWERAEKALEHALELAYAVGERAARISMVLDSLGELRMLRGEFEAARELLGRAVSLATAEGNKWYLGQARRNLARCLLATGDPEGARDEGEEALALAEQIGDRYAICESQLLLAEVHLRQGAYDACQARLKNVSEMTGESVDDLALVGAAQRVYGLLWMALKVEARAIQHLGRSVSIFEMLGDRYRSALAHYELGVAYSATQPVRAAELLSQAASVFRGLGAARDLALAEEALEVLGPEGSASPAAPVVTTYPPALSPLLTLRLAEAAVLRELLLHETAAVIRQETGAQKVLVAEPEAAGHFKVVAAYGYSDEEKKSMAESLGRAQLEG